MGRRYLSPQPLPNQDLLESDLRGLVVPWNPTLLQIFTGVKGGVVERLPVLDVARDGLPDMWPEGIHRKP
jgi:hypothetical protein